MIREDQAAQALGLLVGGTQGWNDEAVAVYLTQLVQDEIKRLRAVLDAVDDLHEPTSVENPRCSSCGDWPCPTHLIVCDECKGGRRG